MPNSIFKAIESLEKISSLNKEIRRFQSQKFFAKPLYLPISFAKVQSATRFSRFNWCHTCSVLNASQTSGKNFKQAESKHKQAKVT
jgi:hypothetical protein